MPRPTPAQFAYGSVTVICSTLAMLFLSKAPSGPGVAVIAVVALVLGVLVALSVPGTSARRTGTGRGSRTAPAHASAAPAASRVPFRNGGTTSPHAAAGRPAPSARRVAEPSLRS